MPRQRIGSTNSVFALKAEGSNLDYGHTTGRPAMSEEVGKRYSNASVRLEGKDDGEVLKLLYSKRLYQ